ncbi:ABC transporter permease [Oceanithermus sp.]
MVEIPLVRLLYPLALALLVAWWYVSWSGDRKTPWVALSRMLAQLLLVGYVLAYIFKTEYAAVVLGVLALMSLAAGWIALRTETKKRLKLYPFALIGVVGGGGLALAVATQLVLKPDPWYSPSVLIPLGGMAFSNAMNAVSLAAERFFWERREGKDPLRARALAYKAALIPATNGLFAVGIVSIPGLMTGQILAGVSPLIAARYQILVMLMVYSASGLAAAMFLEAARRMAVNDRT